MAARQVIACMLLVLVGCEAPAPVTPREPATTTLCACRALCYPDAYAWELVSVGDLAISNGGRCTCVGP